MGVPSPGPLNPSPSQTGPVQVDTARLSGKGFPRAVSTLVQAHPGVRGSGTVPVAGLPAEDPSPAPRVPSELPQASRPPPPSEVIFRSAHTRWKKRPGHLTAGPGGCRGAAGTRPGSSLNQEGAAARGGLVGPAAPARGPPWPRHGHCHPHPAPPRPVADSQGSPCLGRAASLTPSGPDLGWSGSPTIRRVAGQPLSPSH